MMMSLLAETPLVPASSRHLDVAPAQLRQVARCLRPRGRTARRHPGTPRPACIHGCYAGLVPVQGRSRPAARRLPTSLGATIAKWGVTVRSAISNTPVQRNIAGWMFRRVAPLGTFSSTDLVTQSESAASSGTSAGSQPSRLRTSSPRGRRASPPCPLSDSWPSSAPRR